MLIKLAGEGGVADNSGEETREVRARETEVRARGARKIFYLEAEEIADKTRRGEDGVADNFTEGDEFPERRRCRRS